MRCFASHPFLFGLTQTELDALSDEDIGLMTRVSRLYGAARCIAETARLLHARKCGLPYRVASPDTNVRRQRKSRSAT